MAGLLGVAGRHQRRNGVQARLLPGDFHGAGEENSRRKREFLNNMNRKGKMASSDEVPTPSETADTGRDGYRLGWRFDSAPVGASEQ
jgi:hypothetical protein